VGCQGQVSAHAVRLELRQEQGAIERRIGMNEVLAPRLRHPGPGATVIALNALELAVEDETVVGDGAE
jgi:hypothetical protein